MNNEELLLKKWSEQDQVSVMQLLNHKLEPVAALYLNKLNIDKIAIINNSKILNEKYYLYIDGIAVFFTYFRKLDKDTINQYDQIELK